MTIRCLRILLLTLAIFGAGCGPTQSTATPGASTSGATVDQVCEIAAELYGVDHKQMRGETSLGDLNADELDFVELIMELEEHFGIAIPDDAAERTLGTDDWKLGMKNVTMTKLARLVDDRKGSAQSRTHHSHDSQAPSDADSQPGQVKVFLNPLVMLLSAAEKEKRRPLTREEVLLVRDNAAFVMMSDEQAKKFYESLDSKIPNMRIDPDRVWEEWQAVRKEMR